MILHLTPTEMLDLWALHTGFRPPIHDAGYERTDGIDPTSIFMGRIRAWYHRLLREAPPEWLCTEDLAPRTLLPAGGTDHIDLPDSVVRVCAVDLESWRGPATIITDPCSRLALRQLHPFTRTGADRPVALFTRGRLDLYPGAAEGDSLSRLEVVAGSDDSFDFDEAALTLIPRCE